MNRTRLKARVLDRLRARRVGKNTSLQLIKYAQTGGETLLATVTQGWSPVTGTDSETSSVTVEIAEQNGVTSSMMIPAQGSAGVNRMRFLDKSFRIEKGGIQPPVTQPRFWRVVGEEIRA